MLEGKGGVRSMLVYRYNCNYTYNRTLQQL